MDTCRPSDHPHPLKNQLDKEDILEEMRHVRLLDREPAEIRAPAQLHVGTTYD